MIFCSIIGVANKTLFKSIFSKLLLIKLPGVGDGELSRYTYLGKLKIKPTHKLPYIYT